SCQGKGWRELREEFEPAAYTRNNQSDQADSRSTNGSGPREERDGASAEPDPDPVLAALDQALTTHVDIAAGITFEQTTADLVNGRTHRRKSRVVCEDLLRSHCLAMLVGRPWAGKSTIAAYFARCLQWGEKFFGHQCYPSRVGYMGLERNGEQVAVQFEEWGI